jgi:uncharacterized protein YndB with AHSA1/START domain
MTNSNLPEINPELDLVLEREIDVTPEAVWAAWTEPEQLLQWFTPRPWQTIDCRIDLRPGGEFYTQMRSPEGEEMQGGSGCYLEVVPNRRLVWTAVLLPGYRPAPEGELPFTATILMEPTAMGTKYTAIAMHRDPAVRQQHEEMGFYDGWGAALTQLVEYVKSR